MAKPNEDRNKLFWIVAILAAVPAVCFFVVGICVVDKASWFMAGFTYLVAVFTFLLWRATKEYAETTKEYTDVNKEYTEITRKLLKQSEEAFKQSRTAFLANIFGDLTAYVKEQRKLNKPSGPYIFRMLVAFGKIDKKIAEEVWELMKTWTGENTKLWEYLETYDESFRTNLKDF